MTSASGATRIGDFLVAEKFRSLVEFSPPGGHIRMTLLARRNLPGPFAVPVSEELLAELADVFSRPQTERYLRPDRASRFMSRLIKVSEWMEVLTPYPDFTDPKDRFLLAMLHDGEADLLVTGDKALLSLGQFQGKPIVSPTVFVSEYLPSP